MVHLRVQAAEHSQEIDTDEAVVTIGRASRNTVRISDDQSSREHCRIERSPDGSWRLVDLASRNGTHLNGQLVDQRPLAHGDVIRIGSTTITFELPTGERAAAEPDGPRATPEPQGPKAIRLVFTAGSKQGHTEVIFEKLTSIGRRPQNTIVLSDRGVSNRHAEIRRGPDGFVLVDIGSRNGTFHNGRLILRNAIAPGDQIRIGKTCIQVKGATLDADTAAQATVAAAEPAEPEEGMGPETTHDALVASATWPRTAAALGVAIAIAATAGYSFRRDIRAWVTSAPRRVPDLLDGTGSFDDAKARQAWQPAPDTEARLTHGRLELVLPSRGPIGSLASCVCSEPLEVTRYKRYAVSARVRSERLASGFAGVLATWVGRQPWQPRAGLLLRPEPGPEPWARASQVLAPPPWADLLELRCVAAANSGLAAFDDVAIVEAQRGEPLPRLVAGPLALVMDTPVLLSLTHDETLVSAGAGIVVDPGERSTAVRQPRGAVASGFPKLKDGRYQCRSTIVLPPDGVELWIEQTAARGQGGLRLDYKVWTSKELAVEFAGLELPCDASVLRSGLDVRTASGFVEPARDETAFAVDDVSGVAWSVGGGRLFVASDAPLAVESRSDGARGALLVGRRGAVLRQAPMTLSLSLRGTTPAEERGFAAALLAARTAARRKRYGEAIRRFEELARLHPQRRAAVEAARTHMAQLRREAVARADQALRLLERAELTGEDTHFDAAEAALQPLRAGLKGTAHEKRIADALTQCRERRLATAQRRDERQAASLLRTAREQHNSQNRHIARLYCRELLARFPRSAAADDARAFLRTLDQPPPPAPKAPAPKGQ